MATDQSSPPTNISEQLRSQARWRSHFWPGAGFALLDHSGLACLGTATIALLPATFLGLAFAFGSFFFWSIVASLVIYLCFYMIEQMLCRSIAIRAGGEKVFLSKFLVPLCAAGYFGFIGALVVVVLNVSSLRIAGQGMAPTLAAGDRLLYKKHVYREDLNPGHLVFFLTSPDSAWGKGGDLIVARILAVPGNELSIEGDHYLINGKRNGPASPLGNYQPSIEIPQVPQTLTVPVGCYFIVQDSPQKSYDSRVLSWARESDLIGTRAVVLIGRGFGNAVE